MLVPANPVDRNRSRARCSPLVSLKPRGLAIQLPLVDYGRISHESGNGMDRRVHIVSFGKSGSTRDDRTTQHIGVPFSPGGHRHCVAVRAAVIHAYEIGADVGLRSDTFGPVSRDLHGGGCWRLGHHATSVRPAPQCPAWAGWERG